MATRTKSPQSFLDSLVSNTGSTVWNNLGPHTKWRIITAGASIVAEAAGRSFLRKTGKYLLVGVIIAGAILAVNAQKED